VRLEESGEISGDVLDVGCGTGENALFLASRGQDVWGVDSAPTAIEIARRKAEERDLAATFLVTDTLNLHEIGRTFDTVIDSGLFHAFSYPEHPCFVRSVSEVLKPGGTYFMLAFSDREPGDTAPAGSPKRRYRLPFLMGRGLTASRPWSLRAAQDGRLSGVVVVDHKGLISPVTVIYPGKTQIRSGRRSAVTFIHSRSVCDPVGKKSRLTF